MSSSKSGKNININNNPSHVWLDNYDGIYENSYIRSLGNDEYAIQNTWFERYVRVQKKGNNQNVDIQTYVGSSERFYITCFDNGDVAFKSKKYGNYLRGGMVVYDDEGLKVSTSTSIGRTEKWRLITEGLGWTSPKPERTYYIKSAHGYYIYMNNKNKVKLMKHNKSYERITLRSMCGGVYWHDCDIYAIKSATHGERYLSVPGSGGGQKVGAQTHVRSYEKFYMETLSNGKVMFKSFKHKNYLHANEKDKSKLDTSKSSNKASEDNYSQFTLIPV